MSWSPTIYVQFPDEAAARAMALELGVEFPEQTGDAIPTGNHNFVLQAPIPSPWRTPPAYEQTEDGLSRLATPGVPEPGYWAMLRLNADWPGCEPTMAVLEASGAVRDLTEPPADFF